MCAWIKAAFFIALLGLAIYTTVQFVGPYDRELTFKSDVKEILKFELQSTDDATAKILDKAKRLHVPLDPENLSVTLENGQFRAQASWSETVSLFNQYHKKLNFSFDIESPKQEGG
ncbi:MAG: hypothetical protein M0Z52_06145 [Actinomycetota bacterium]|nr:hypothetical protein [Actinomycetota bacterium]